LPARARGVDILDRRAFRRDRWNRGRVERGRSDENEYSPHDRTPMRELFRAELRFWGSRFHCTRVVPRTAVVAPTKPWLTRRRGALRWLVAVASGHQFGIRRFRRD